MTVHFAGTPAMIRRPWYTQILIMALKLLSMLIQPLKDAAIGIQVNSALFLLIMGKFFWLIPFIVYPDIFSTFPTYYHSFAQAAPQWVWAISILALICIDTFVLMRKIYEGQVLCFLLGAIFWFFLAKQISAGVPHGLFNIPASSMAGMCFGAGIGCMVTNYRLIQTHGAQMEAHRMLIVGRQVEIARDAGEPWAQPDKSSTNKGTTSDHPQDKDLRSVGRDYATTTPLH